MKILPGLIAVSTFALISIGHAGEPATYQVTGRVTALTDTTITVTENKEPYLITRTADTKVTGNLTIGAEVTITYTVAKTMIDVSNTYDPANPRDSLVVMLIAKFVTVNADKAAAPTPAK